MGLLLIHGQWITFSGRLLAQTQFGEAAGEAEREAKQQAAVDWDSSKNAF